jgi:purine-cytosine permease-like protein
MTLIKIVIVVTIIILLRRHLGFLKPYWHVIAGYILATLFAWWLLRFFFAQPAIVLEISRSFNCPPWLVKPASAALGGLMTAGPIIATIRRLFPYREDDNRNAR